MLGRNTQLAVAVVRLAEAAKKDDLETDPTLIHALANAAFGSQITVDASPAEVAERAHSEIDFLKQGLSRNASWQMDHNAGVHGIVPPDFPPPQL